MSSHKKPFQKGQQQQKAQSKTTASTAVDVDKKKQADDRKGGQSKPHVVATPQKSVTSASQVTITITPKPSEPTTDDTPPVEYGNKHRKREIVSNWSKYEIDNLPNGNDDDESSNAVAFSELLDVSSRH